MEVLKLNVLVFVSFVEALYPMFSEFLLPNDLLQIFLNFSGLLYLVLGGFLILTCQSKTLLMFLSQTCFKYYRVLHIRNIDISYVHHHCTLGQHVGIA